MEPHWAIVVQLVVLPGLVVAGALLYSSILCRPSIDTSAPADLLILAAHPDDCAIIAGEYAQVSAAANKSIRIVYLTCGSVDPSDERAQARRQECHDAWSILGVPASNLAFFDLPHTDPATNSAPTPRLLDQARGELTEILRSLAPGTRVFLPADGETHADHRSLREIALRAFTQVNRTDLEAFEAPEYNPYLSLARSPLRALLYVMTLLPLIGRLVDRRRFIPPPAFFEGPAGLVLSPDSERLATKCRMLRHFTSENEGDVLVRHFGFPDHFRKFNPIASLDAKPGRWFLRVGERFLSPGIIAWWLSLWTAILVLVYIAGRWKVRWLGAGGLFGNSTAAVSITAALGMALLVIAIIRRHSVERRVTIFVSGAGLIAGGLAAEEVLFDALQN